MRQVVRPKNGWRLETIAVHSKKARGRGETFWFHCDRWLALADDQSSVQHTLLAGVQMQKYNVQVEMARHRTDSSNGTKSDGCRPNSG